jgi:TonB family protein
MRAIAKWVARVFAVALLLTVPGIRAQKDEVVHDENVYLSDFAELDYPVLARQAHVEGVVVVRVGLDSQGDVISSAPISGNKLLIPDCLENAKKWRFQPSSPKTVIIVYEFRRDDRMCHNPCRSLFLIRPPNFATVTTGAGTLEP